jgi:hypothetical protein
MQTIANYSNLSKKAAVIVLSFSALEKLGDSKIAESFILCILTICEVIGPKFVVSQIIKNPQIVQSQKSLMSVLS